MADTITSSNKEITDMQLSNYDIETLTAYAKRRANEEYFEIEELFDMLDSIAPTEETTQESKDSPGSAQMHVLIASNEAGDVWTVLAHHRYEDVAAAKTEVIAASEKSGGDLTTEMLTIAQTTIPFTEEQQQESKNLPASAQMVLEMVEQGIIDPNTALIRCLGCMAPQMIDEMVETLSDE